MKIDKAEFKTLRENIGLSVQDLANLVNVADRSVRRWESSCENYECFLPPDEICEQLKKIDHQLDNAAFEAVVKAKTQASQCGEKPKVIQLFRYKNNDELWADYPEMEGLPVSTHAVMLFRSKKELEKQGFIAEISYS